MITRRQFVLGSAAMALTTGRAPLGLLDGRSPALEFPQAARERISVASYHFRDFIVDPGSRASGKIPLQDFASHVIDKFQVNKIEPWTGHFPSTDQKYIAQFRSSVERVHAMVVDIAVDGEHSPYASNRREREEAIAFGKKWVEVAVGLGAPSIRTNLPPAKDSKPDLERAAASLSEVALYASRQNVVVHLENDNPVSEDPFFLVKLIEKVNSPWLRALPDFANTLANFDADHAYQGIDLMFQNAYGICHVKEMEVGRDGKLVHVDLARTFAILKRHGYKGYLSMEWDSPGDPYAGTRDLMNKTLAYLS
jgi:sugar phosphate isomerase/epimerase